MSATVTSCSSRAVSSMGSPRHRRLPYRGAYLAPAPVDLAGKPDAHRDQVHAPLHTIRASFRLAPGLGPGPRLVLRLDAFGKPRASRLAVPLFEGLVGDLAL